MFTEEDYVSLETAKLLKKKGFDEKTHKRYVEKIEGSEREEWDDEEIMYTTVWDVNIYPKPTLYEAQKWLKDRKRLVVEISYMSGDYYIYDVLTIPNHDLVGLANRIPTNYNTFQQALDAGIQEALKLI